MGTIVWSQKKAKEDGFYAWVQRFIGLVVDFPGKVMWFELEKWVKLLMHLETCSDRQTKGVNYGMVQSVFGLMAWMVETYTVLKAFTCGWIRCLNNVPTDSLAKCNESQGGLLFLPLIPLLLSPG